MHIIQINSTDASRATEIAQLNQWIRELTATIDTLQKERSALAFDLNTRVKNLEVAVARLQVGP